jgi:hypothetical protein
LKDEKGAKMLYLSREYVLAELVFDDWRVSVVAKTVQAKPADFEDMLEENCKGAKLVSLSEELTQAVRRANVLTADDLAKAVTLTPSVDALMVEASGPLGEIKAKVRCKGIKQSDAYRVNPDLLLRGLGQCSQIGFGAKALTLADEAEEVSTMMLVATIATKE